MYCFLWVKEREHRLHTTLSEPPGVHDPTLYKSAHSKLDFMPTRSKAASGISGVFKIGSRQKRIHI